MTQSKQLISTDKLFKDLDKKIDDSFRNQLIMAIYQALPRDYGNGITLREIDMHALGYIRNSPGITSKELGSLMYRTKGPISTLVTRLEKEGLLRQETTPYNRKEHRLFLTEKGIATHQYHITFDRQKTSEFIIYLSQYCTPEEIDGFFKVLSYRTLFFEEEIEKSKVKREKSKKKASSDQ